MKRISPENPANLNWLIDLCREVQEAPYKILIFFHSTDRLGSAQYDDITYTIAQSPYTRDRAKTGSKKNQSLIQVTA